MIVVGKPHTKTYITPTMDKTDKLFVVTPSNLIQKLRLIRIPDFVQLPYFIGEGVAQFVDVLFFSGRYEDAVALCFVGPAFF